MALTEPGWTLKPDGDDFVRRAVPSPRPQRILQLDAIKALLAAPPTTVAAHAGAAETSPLLPIACGGGGVPVVERTRPDGTLAFDGVEAVIDKDHCGALLAASLEADGFIILTDGGGIWERFGKPGAREMAAATCQYLLDTDAGKGFPGSMGPKVQAAIAFLQASASAGRPGAWAAIGDLRDAQGIVAGKEGTRITVELGTGTGIRGVAWRE